MGLGISISVDELAIGFGLGLTRLPLIPVIVAIAVQAFLASRLGLLLGARIGERFREAAERLAGIALIALGLFLLAERLLAALFTWAVEVEAGLAGASGLQAEPLSLRAARLRVLSQAGGDVAGTVAAVFLVPGAGGGVGDAEQVGQHLPVHGTDQREPGSVAGRAGAGDPQLA